MKGAKTMAERSTDKRHFTTRRAFVGATGFGVLGLYFLWAGYGAAPLLPDLHGGESEGHGGHGPGGHGGHGAAESALSIDEFRELAEAFAKDYAQPDGSVRPRGDGHGPVDVYLAAFSWGYAPAVLRLEAGTPYRFQMMALDVAHGASIHLGSGARIIRLRPGVLVEQELTFHAPGEYLVYCTIYCGVLHDRMQGKIIVEEART
jgi:cytochrome c oxidase subunit II